MRENVVLFALDAYVLGLIQETIGDVFLNLLALPSSRVQVVVRIALIANEGKVRGKGQTVHVVRYHTV